MKKIIFLGLMLISTTFSNAQQVINYHKKQITIQGPVCSTMNVRGYVMEYHHVLQDKMICTTVIMTDSKSGKITSISISKVQVNNITDEDFGIDFSDKYGGDLYMTLLNTEDDKVAVVDYEGSDVTKYKSSGMSLYFSEKQVLLDFLEEIKKQRGS